MRVRSAVLLGLATLLFGCAEQPTGFATGYNSHDGPAYATPVYPGYSYAPGYLGPGYYGSDVFIGGGGYWAGGKDRDPYWYHRHHGRDRDGVWQGNELLRHQNETQARAQAWQQLQQQKAATQAAQAQATLQQQKQKTAAQAAQAQAVQQLYQQRAQALAAQNQAILQQRAAQAQAVQQLYQQRAQALAAQQQAIAAARARGLAQ